MKRHLWVDLLLLVLVTLAVQSPHLFAKWDESLWGMEGAFYGIGVKNFFRYDASEHHGLLVQNGSPEVEEPLRYYARTLMPFYWAEGLFVYIFGDREWAYRIVPVIHGWLLAAFLYLLVLEAGNRRTALIAGILAGASPMVGYYSTCTYSGPAACYIPGLLWAYLLWVKCRSPTRTATFALLLVLCWSGNYFNLFFLPALIFLHWRRAGKWFRFSLGVGGSFLAVHLLQILHFLSVDPTLGILLGNILEWTPQSDGDKTNGYSLTVLVNGIYGLVRLLTPMGLGLACFGLGSFFSPKGSDPHETEVGPLLALSFPAIAIMLVFPGHTLVHEHDFYWIVAPMAWLSAMGLNFFLDANRRPTILVTAVLLLVGNAFLFYRGNLACWYKPDHTLLFTGALSLPLVLLIVGRAIGVEPKWVFYLTLSLWVASSVGYTATLWGDSNRVENAIFVKENSGPSDRIAAVTSTYPLDLYYAVRSITPVPGPVRESGSSIDQWLRGLRSEGFDHVFVSSDFALQVDLVSEKDRIHSEGGRTLIDLEAAN